MVTQECRKVKFGTEAFADEYVKKLQSTSKRNKIPVRSYLCEKCLCWHITSRYDHKKIITELGKQVKEYKDLSESRLLLIKQQQEAIRKYKKKIQELKSNMHNAC